MAREEHLLKYPGYVYQPTRKDKPVDEDFSPLKRSGSMRSQTNLSRSAPASRVQHSRSNTLEDDTSDIDERAQSPTPSKASRSRTPLKQSRIPVPMSLNKGATYRPSQRQPVQSQGGQSSISGSVRKPVQANRPGASIVKTAADFANQCGLLDPSSFNSNSAPVSTAMAKSRSAPSHTASSVAQTPSAPRYAKSTAASMSKSLSQPVATCTQTASQTASVHPQHQYAAYSHLQQPMPQDPNQMVASRAGLFEQMLSSTPTNRQRLVFPDVTPPEGQHSNGRPVQRLASGSGQQPSAGRPHHQRAHTIQPAIDCTGSATPSRAPSMRRMKTSPPQGTAASPAIPDGFVIGGKLYPYENVEEAMKAFQSAAPTPQKSTNRILSNHSNASNGPVQEIAMPMPSASEQQHQQPQFYAPPAQNYVIGIAPDGQQIPLLLSQPQSVTTFAPWQSVPAFTPSSTLATPSTGFAYDFGQSQDSLQTFDYNSVFTPNTANSNVSTMPLSGTTWFPQQSSGNVDMATSNFLVTNDPTLGGISPTFYLNDANGQQQAYTLAGPPVSVDIGEVTDFTPSQGNVQQWAIA